MFKKTNIILLGIIPFIDIFIENIYQGKLLLSLNSELKQYHNLSEKIFEDHHTLESIRKSIIHTIMHISTNILLISVCMFLVAITINHKLRTYLIKFLHPILYLFPTFLDVSSFEILILEVQCGIIRTFESKWILSLFFNEHSIMHKLWPILIFLIWVPFEIRFKIYSEKKLHHKAPVFIGTMHALSIVSFPIIYLLISKMIHKCSLIGSITLLDNPNKISIYHLKTKSEHLEIIPISYFNSFIIKGDISHHGSDVMSTLLFESSKFGLVGIVVSLIFPFVKNLIFAFFVVYCDKKYLKMFCSNDIHHICAHLITEEFLNLGFSKYLLSPVTLIENQLICSYDDKIRSFLSDKSEKEAIVSEYFDLQLHNHKNIHSSLFYSLFNNETNIISRMDRILSK